MPDFPEIPSATTDVSHVTIPDHDPYRLPTFPPPRQVTEEQRPILDALLATAYTAGALIPELEQATKWARDDVATSLERQGLSDADRRNGLAALAGLHIADLAWVNVHERTRPLFEVCEDMGLSGHQIRSALSVSDTLRELRPSGATFPVQRAFWPSYPDLTTYTLPVPIPATDPFVLPEVTQAARTDISALVGFDFDVAVVRAFRAGESMESLSRRSGVAKALIHQMLRDAGLPENLVTMTGALTLADLHLTEMVTHANVIDRQPIDDIARHFRLPRYDVITRIIEAQDDVRAYAERGEDEP